MVHGKDDERRRRPQDEPHRNEHPGGNGRPACPAEAPRRPRRRAQRHLMKRTAIVSDVHSILEALEAVIEDAAANDCSEILCLGDLIGYGPNPRQVLRIALENFRFTLMGNHEEGVLYQPVGFNWKAEASAWWTKDQLRSKRYPGRENESYWRYLQHLPRYVEEGDVLYVHASPLDPTKEYVMPEATDNPEYMKMMFAKIRRV